MAVENWTSDWHEYPYNYSNGTEVNGTGNLIQWSNEIVGGALGGGILIIIWLATFGLSMMLGAKKAMMAASFITFVFSIYLVRLDMINPVFVIVLIVLTIIGALGSKEQTGGL